MGKIYSKAEQNKLARTTGGKFGESMPKDDSAGKMNRHVLFLPCVSANQLRNTPLDPTGQAPPMTHNFQSESAA